MPPLWLEQSGEATFCPRPHVAPCSRARAPFFSLSLKTGIRARKTLAALDKLAPGRNRGDEIEGALATLRLRSEIESTAGRHHAGAAWSRHGPARLFTSKDAIHVASGAAILLVDIVTVRDQAAARHEIAPVIDGWQFVARGQSDD